MTSKSNDRNSTSTSTFFSFIGKTGEPFFLDEKSNSLGNVQVVISDKKVGVDNTGDGWVDFYRADVRSAGDYYPFGSPMPDRSFYSTDYRFGFNGMEKVEEIASTGNHYTTEFRELDPRLGGRWWSPDIVVKPWESPYAGFSNNPIYFSDPSGLDPIDDKKPQGNIENTTGTWETKNPDGSYTGQPAEPIALKGIEISASKDPTPAPSKSSSTISTTTSSNTYDGQKVANFSLSQNEKYMYGRYRKVTPDVRPIPKDPIQGKSYFDCTGWVGYVCMQLYPDLAKALNLGPASNIYTYALKHGGIRKGNPKIGDMAL